MIKINTIFQLLEQNNFALSEFIQNKKAESNYEPIKNKVSKLGTNKKQGRPVENQ